MNNFIYMFNKSNSFRINNNKVCGTLSAESIAEHNQLTRLMNHRNNSHIFNDYVDRNTM